ncbi:guanine nucleotide exchange factor DBS-like isoform X2 [Pocillopora damicornis]|uniref:guanine nucleotide exchange factor DBS-like isoform X2 n=1 Tax=Pocillopora damicornis TaxID=46731 RepID=UPI000F54CF88|nr:guanine nucleotide exchange factor DBS-like isoform X2 [Pocillopora damicornis]
MSKKSNRFTLFVKNYEEPKIKAIEIAALLQEKYAFLTGAQAKNGCLFVTIPEHPKFGNLSDRDTERILKYLVELASDELVQKGFILVLDRRKDKWGAVKSCLQKLQKCFPSKASINVVYVLKPQGFFQKYSKPSFVADGSLRDSKTKVVSLNCAAELEEYIDKSQLTEELGGSLQYRHVQWVQYRTAIERFERNLTSFNERTAELKQVFSKTKLSSSVPDMEQIIETQEEMWQDIREDMESAHQAGVTLLDCIHPKQRDGADEWYTPDIKANAAELKEFLVKLKEMENDIEKLWKEQKAMIQYGLKVCLFEREINQTTGLLLSSLGNLSAMTDLGDSRDDAQSMLNELTECADRSTQELLDKAKGLVAKGLKMIESHEQSKESIKMKCDEIKELCDKFDKAVLKREDDLKKAIDIHECLEMVNKWCKTGGDLLALQPIDRFQSSEGAEKALEEIDNFLKSPQGMNMVKVRKMTPMSTALGNKTLISKVKDSLKRISEVNDMMAKRETGLKKLVVKRPVQPVSAFPASQASIPDEQKDSKRRFSQQLNLKSPVQVRKIELKKSNVPESPKRPVSIVLDSLQVQDGMHSSLSEPSIQRVIVDGTDSPEAAKKRSQVMKELIQTEKDYVYDLEHIVKGYLKEFARAGKKIPADLRGKKNIIFGNIEQIYEFHKNDFLLELESCQDQPSLVGATFIMKSNEFEMYAAYCKNKPSSEALRLDYINLPFFKECQERLGHLLPLSAYLLKPVQRITKYQLLLREMMKLTLRNSTAYDDLEKALDTMEGVLRHVNDVMHSCCIRGFPGNLAEQGKLLLQDSFMVWETNKTLKVLPLKGGRQRQVFMYEKLIIFSKKDVQETSKEAVLYKYRKDIKTCDVGFTETVPDAPEKFELWRNGRSEVFLLQPVSLEIKTRWVKGIRNLLQSQFDQVKEQSTIHDRWKSTSALSSAPTSTESQLRSRSQSSFSIASTVAASNNNSNRLK